MYFKKEKINTLIIWLKKLFLYENLLIYQNLIKEWLLQLRILFWFKSHNIKKKYSSCVTIIIIKLRS